MRQPESLNDERNFGEFRRKVKSAEVLSASDRAIDLSLRFTGKLSVVMQNGRVLKSGYEEAIFPATGRSGSSTGLKSSRDVYKPPLLAHSKTRECEQSVGEVWAVLNK